MVVKRKPVPVKDKPKPEREIGLCGECVNCTPIWLHHTLTVKDRKPTMGECPYVTNRKVLLSEKGCFKWMKRDGTIQPIP